MVSSVLLGCLREKNFKIDMYLVLSIAIVTDVFFKLRNCCARCNDDILLIVLLSSSRYLRRKLFSLELRLGRREAALAAVLEWLPGVWATLNAFLEAHSSSDVTVGPRLFLACPMDLEASQVRQLRKLPCRYLSIIRQRHLGLWTGANEDFIKHGIKCNF